MLKNNNKPRLLPNAVLLSLPSTYLAQQKLQPCLLLAQFISLTYYTFSILNPSLVSSSIRVSLPPTKCEKPTATMHFLPC